MEQITKNFTLSELTHSNIAKTLNIENIPRQKEIENLQALAEKVLQPIRDLIGKPMIISSGFRSKKVNTIVLGAKNSQHIIGEAADWSAESLNAREAFDIVKSSNIPFDQLILYDDGKNNFVHVSHKNGSKQRGQILYSKGTSE